MKPTTLLAFATAVGLVHGHVVPSSNQNAQLEARRLSTGAQVEEPARREEAETDTFISGGGRRGVLEPQYDELPARSLDEEPARREEAETGEYISPGYRRGVLEPQDDELPTRSFNKEPSERAEPEPEFSSGPGRRDDFMPGSELPTRSFNKEPSERAEPEPEFSSGPGRRDDFIPEDEELTRRFTEDEELARSVRGEGEELLRRAEAAPDTFTNPNSRRRRSLSPFKGNVGRQTLKRRIRDYEVPSPVGVERAAYPGADQDDA